MELREAISAWLVKYGAVDVYLEDLRISGDEWQQVHYLIILLCPFFDWTNRLSRSFTPVIGKAWATYTSFFKNLENLAKLLSRKSEPWKARLTLSVTAAHRKLLEYYSRIDGLGGTFFNHACILDPMHKPDLYRSPAFKS